MGKTSVDARRHIREWSEFFRVGSTATEELIEDFLKRHRKRKYLKQGLRRLIARGLIEKRRNKFRLTRLGSLFFLRRQPNSFSQKGWDGKWRLISFDVPVKDDYKRVQLRGLLKEFNFFQLQKSVWVCPNYLTEEFWKLVAHYELAKYCKAMLVEIIDGDEELRSYFKLPTHSSKKP